LLVAAVWHIRSSNVGESLQDAQHSANAGCSAARDMFDGRQSGQWVTLSGEVQRLLGDTYGHYEHQRFILQCADGLHVLIVNDVSVGQRVPIMVHHRIAVRGQYIWDAQGGLVHFTHRANGGEPGGWILFAGRVYQ
jgi:Protein of unknown function (DUF3465)